MPPIVIGAVALGGAAVAAGGIGLALAATGTFVGFAANFGVSMLLSGVAQALAPKPKQQGLSSRDVTVREPAHPREVVYGQTRKGGVIVALEVTGKSRLSDESSGFFEGFVDDLGEAIDDLGQSSKNSSDNKFLHVVIVLAGHQIEAIDEIYFDGDLAVNADGSIADAFAGKVEVEKRLGADDQTAFPIMMDYLPGKWTEEHKLSGCAAIALHLEWDTDKFPNGLPNVTANIRGKNDILDPRTGMVGYTDNAALCVADYLASSIYGMGAEIGDARGINEDALIAGANACDEIVNTVDNTTETRYTLNGIIDTSQTPQTIIEAMLSSMAGHAVRRSGQWYIQPGIYRTPSLTLTEDDASGPLKLVTRLSRSDNFNGVRGTFISPDNDWQVDDFPAYTSAAYTTEDRGIRSWRDIALPFTISPSMAQRIAKIQLEMARRQMSVEWPGKLNVMEAGCGDVIQLTRPRWGFDQKPFVVTGFTFSTSADGLGLVPSLQMSETSPLVYDWDATEGQIYAAAPRSNLPSGLNVAAPGISGVSESLYVTRDNAVKARATVSWSESSSAGISRYDLQGSLDGGDYADLASVTGLRATLDDIAPGNWSFRIRAVSIIGVSSDWSVYAAEIYGLGVAPAAITGATLQAAGGLAIIKWVLHPDLDVRAGGHIVIRHSTLGAPAWSASRSLDEISGNQTIAAMPLMPGTYILRARDSTGNLGPETMLYASGAQVIGLVSTGTLQEDDEFFGAKSGTAAIGGQLTLGAYGDFDDVADVDALPTWDYPFGIVTSGSYNFAADLDLGSIKRVRLRSVIEMLASNRSDDLDARPGIVDLWPSWDAKSGAECDAYVEIQVSDDGASWTDWSRIDASEVEARCVRARAILSTTDTSFVPLISKLRLNADEVS